MIFNAFYAIHGEIMQKKSIAVTAVSLTIAIMALLPAALTAQHTVQFDLDFSLQLDGDHYGNELELGYTNRLLHIKNNLYLYARGSAFYQPESLTGVLSVTSDAAEYTRYRYGAAAGTGLFFEGNIGAQLGVGISRHYLRMQKTSGGLPPPAGSGISVTAPDHQFHSYTMFDFTLGLNHDINKSIIIGASLTIQAALGDEPVAPGLVIAPALGAGYSF